MGPNFKANHRFTTTLQRQIYGHATKVAIRPLNEEKVVQAAADLLGALFVFLVEGDAVIYEVQSRSRAEARKEKLRKKELETAYGIIFPIVKSEGVRQMFFPITIPSYNRGASVVMKSAMFDMLG